MAKVQISEVGERVRVAVKQEKYMPQIIGQRTIKRDQTGIYILYNKRKYRNLVWSGNTLIAQK